MKKLVVMFSGWLEIDVNDVELDNIDGDEPITKTAAGWLEERGNIDGLILTDFSEVYKNATDGAFEDIDLSVEDDELDG